MRLMNFARATSTALVLALAVVAPTHAATTWDAVTDFSSTQSSGVNGVWSYGWDDGSGFQAYARDSECIARVSCWQTPGPNLAYLVPLVAKTVVGGTVDYSTVIMPTNVLNLHPGATQPDMSHDIDSLVRFTAPTAGTYKYSGFFEVLDTSPSGVHAYANGSEVFISGHADHPGMVGPSTAFSGSQYLLAGKTIDFRVNRDGQIWNDSTGLSTTISAVPEPASWALMIGGFGGIGAVLRRRRVNSALATA